MQCFSKKFISIALVLSAILFFSCKKKNHPPEIPSTPSGLSSGHVGAVYQFSTITTDQDGDSVSYQFDWGDGDTSVWGNVVQVGIYIMMSKSWLSPGIYSVKARARDNKYSLSDWSPGCSINIGPNHPPNPPSTPDGPSGGAIDTLYSFSASTTDPDEDSISYQFDWGNGNTTAWSEFKANGSSVTMSKSWAMFGTYYVKTRAKDNLGAISDWSDSLYVSIRLKWRYKTGGNVSSSPAIGPDGTIYFGSYDDCIYALNPDGTFKWRYQTSGDVYSSPAIGSDGTIYFGSYDSCFYALNLSGSLKWRYQTDRKIISSPAIGSDGTVYFGSNDGYLYTLSPDGTLKWRYQTDHYIYSSPAIGLDGTIYVGSDEYLYALNPDSTLKWRYQADVVFSSPAIGLDGSIYFASENYSYALNPDGMLKWRYLTGEGSSPAIGSDGAIYICASNGLYVFNEDGTIKWEYPVYNASSSPTISSDGTIYFGSSGHYLYALYGSGQLANTPWPKFRHDLKNTGRFGGP
jgi:outer membrane protein assembly factor BamB